MNKPTILEGFYTKTELYERGWTQKLFALFLPEPHERRNSKLNPERQLNLYKKDVVEMIEADSKFKEYWHWTNNIFRPRMREVAKKRAEAKMS